MTSEFLYPPAAIRLTPATGEAQLQGAIAKLVVDMSV